MCPQIKVPCSLMGNCSHPGSDPHTDTWGLAGLSLSLTLFLSPLSCFVSHPQSGSISLPPCLSVWLYLFWSVLVSKVIASCMDPDSAMVTAGIKPSVKIITAPCWWGTQCYFHSGGIPGELPLPWKCFILAASQSVIAFAYMSYFAEDPWFVIVIMIGHPTDVVRTTVVFTSEEVCKHITTVTHVPFL